MKPISIFVSIVLFGCGVALGAFAPSILHRTSDQPYAGEQDRQISSLSAEDRRALLAGEGWGLAKPAELNGYPGPAHVLEFGTELGLSQAQKSKISQAFDEMNATARKLGKALIEAEAALDEAFRSRSVDTATLDQHLRRAEDVRSSLRSVHLSAHLEITPLLDEAQIVKYAQLRGYDAEHQTHSGH